ncbi:MAG: HAD hydrolase-like protein [archaeon]
MKLIIWDLDGVIANSLKTSMDNFRQAIAPYVKKLPPYKEIFDKYLSSHEELTVLQMLKKYKVPEEFHDHIKQKFLHDKTRSLHTTTFFSGIPELIVKLHKRHIKQLLITGRDKKSAHVILTNQHSIIEGRFLIHYFDAIHTGDDSMKKLEAFRSAMRHFGAKAKDCIVLGDEPHDIECANRLKMYACACLWGAFDNSCLKKKPKKRCKTVRDLALFLRTLERRLRSS